MYCADSFFDFYDFVFFLFLLSVIFIFIGLNRRLRQLESTLRALETNSDDYASSKSADL